jgi:hypothetical protein
MKMSRVRFLPRAQTLPWARVRGWRQNRPQNRQKPQKSSTTRTEPTSSRRSSGQLQAGLQDHILCKVAFRLGSPSGTCFWVSGHVVGALTSWVCARWPDVLGICLSGPPKEGASRGAEGEAGHEWPADPLRARGSLCASHDCVSQPPSGWPTCAFRLRFLRREFRAPF